jgi:tRNA uracil 4-sulfurtransferase
MKVRVRLFSILRERAGMGETELQLPPGATVARALVDLADRVPKLAPTLARQGGLPLLLAVNRDYAKHDTLLRDGDELALLPPVSGGSPMPHGLLLLSGGFDSPVAGSMVLASGRTLDAVHYTMEPFTDDASVHKARDLAKRLGLRRLIVIPLGDDLAEFTRKCGHRYYFVLLKRLMVRVAERVAAEVGATYLVTGENLGQVSSQTLSNMSVVDQIATIPIIRPVMGLDKQEIIDYAKRISTYETSKGPELCDLLGPKHPATHTSVDEILLEEAKLDVEALVKNALSKAATEVLAVRPTVPTRPVATGT